MADEVSETSAENATTSSSVSAEALTSLETENLIDTYHVIAEWIRFADAKAAVVLTVGGALAGLLIPTLKEYLHSDKLLHPTPWWTKMVMVLYFAWLATLLASGISAFQCILPFRRRGQHPALGRCAHFHPAAILAAYTLDEVDRFTGDCSKLGAEGLKKEVTAALLIDSHISGAKYMAVTRSIRLMGYSALIAIAYLVAIQF